MSDDRKLCEIYDPDMQSSELDKLKLTPEQAKKGLIRFIVMSAIGIAVFFGQIDGTTIFSIICDSILNIFGDFIYYILLAIIGFNFCMHVYVKYFKKTPCSSPLTSAYENDGVLKTILFGLGFIFMFIWCMYVNVPSLGFDRFAIIVGEDTGGAVFGPIVRSVSAVLIVGSVFVPALLNYGILEFVGIFMEPMLRPIFKIPGKSALDCCTSFVGSASMGVIVTNRLWKNNTYTNREMVCIMTGFSACSIGYVALVYSTAGLGKYFSILYILNFVMVFAISFFTVRIPPLSKHPDVFYDGRVQTEEERHEGLRYSWDMFPKGIKRGIRRAAIARGPVTDIKNSVKDCLCIMAQVLTMLTTVGLGAMIIAYYTPLFDYIGYLFRPLVALCRIPDVELVAPTMFAGISEMFVPVLMIANKVGEMSEMSRAFICLVSNAQVIFFSETAIVMLATKSPVTAKELVISFLERTIIAMPIASIIVHILF